MSATVDRRIRLRDDELFLAVSREKFDVFRHATILDLAIRRFEKTEFIDARKRCERCNQTDVRAFGRFNRANTSVVRRMNVADFKARAVARKSAWPKRRQAAFVREFRERI